MTSWCSRPENLSDGFFPDDEIELLPDIRPLEVLAAMARGDSELGPMAAKDEARGGWILCDYGENQPLRADIVESRRKERDRKRNQRGGGKVEQTMHVPPRVPRGHHPDATAESHGRHIVAYGQSAPRTSAVLHGLSDVPSPSQPGPGPEDPTQEHQEQSADRRHPPPFLGLLPEANAGSLLTEAEALRMGLPPAPAGVIERRLMGPGQRDPDDSPAVLTRLAHEVLDRMEAGDIERADVDEALKTAAARHGLRYDGDRDRKALDSAEAQRGRQSPAEAALRTATAILRVVAPTAVPIEQFHRLVFDYVHQTWPHADFAEWRDEVVAFLFRPDWYRVDRTGRVVPEMAGLPGKEKIVGYHWKLS